MSEATLESLPPEVLQTVMEGLPPESLQSLRATSSYLSENVDTFVSHLRWSEQLVDQLYRSPADSLSPAELLNGWAAGELGTPAFPATNVPTDVAETVQRMDFTFTAYDATINPDVQSSLLQDYYQVMQQSPQRQLVIRSALEELAGQKLSQGLVYVDDRANDVFGPVDPDTTIPDILNGIDEGRMVLRRG